MTAIGNDFGYEFVFERQVEALAGPGDVVVAISTSGNSPNVINGIIDSKKIGAKTIGLTGQNGGKLSGTDIPESTITKYSKDSGVPHNDWSHYLRHS